MRFLHQKTGFLVEPGAFLAMVYRHRAGVGKACGHRPLTSASWARTSRAQAPNGCSRIANAAASGR
jgi:hypothetical protein